MTDIVLKKDGEHSWITYIKARIRKNLNFIGVIFGSPGSGKTWSGCSIAEQLDSDFDSTRLVMTAREMMALVNSGKLKKGSVVIWDEPQIDLSSRNWQNKTNKLMNYLFTTMRHRNWILLFCVPYPDFVDSSLKKMFHAQFECKKINYKEKFVKLKPQLLQYNPRVPKFYNPRLITIYNGKRRKISFWEVPKPSKQLIKEIEKKKSVFTTQLNKEIEIGVQEQYNKESNTILHKPKGLPKEPTEFQQKMIDLAKQGVTRTGEMAVALGTWASTVSDNKRLLRNKGIPLRN